MPADQRCEQVMDRCAKLEADVEVHLERVNATQKQVETVAKRQEQHVAEPVSLGEIRGRIEKLEAGKGEPESLGEVKGRIEKLEAAREDGKAEEEINGRIEKLEEEQERHGRALSLAEAGLSELRAASSPSKKSATASPSLGANASEMGSELEALHEWVGALEGRLTEHEKACGLPSSAASSPAKSKGGGAEEVFARMFEEVGGCTLAHTHSDGGCGGLGGGWCC